MTIFRYIDPPFNFNHPDIAKYPPEVTGNHLLKCMATRLGWSGFTHRRLLDVGCGVRFAQTIANLDLDFQSYAGIDVNAEAIAWLRAALAEPKFRFAHIDAQNPLYNAAGRPLEERAKLPFAGENFDAVCMFSVITHQAPSEAAAILSSIRNSFATQHLYFTAIVDSNVDGYAEADRANPRLLSTYNTALIETLVRDAGWRLDQTYEPSLMQQTVFVCSPL